MKQLFNFYLEEVDKLKAIEKLYRLNGELSKGQLAALIRVMIKQFIATPDDKVSKELLLELNKEYMYSTCKIKGVNYNV